MKKVLFTLCLLASFSLMNAQINTPSASPFCKIEQKVGLTDVTIEYSRPSVKERTIFADNGVVPFGNMWRTGANAATKLTFSDDVTLGGQKVAAGSYALLTVPTASQWTINLYEYDKGSWSSYKEKTPDISFSAMSQKLPVAFESMLIIVENLRDESASIELMWGSTNVSLPLEVESDSKVMDNIEKAIAGTTKSEYYTAASYYYNTGRDLNQALTWIQLANAGDKQKFWQLRRESQILGKLGRYKEAIEVAEKSMALSEKAGNMEYVKFNKEAIAEWSGKMKK